MNELLTALSGPVSGSEESAQVESKLYSEDHFTHEVREKEIKQRMSKALTDIKNVLEILEPTKEEGDRSAEIKNKIYNEGMELIDRFESEIHRKLTEQALVIFCSLLTLLIGIMFLAFPNHITIEYILSLVAAGLGILGIFYNKIFTQKIFLQIERELNIIKQKQLQF